MTHAQRSWEDVANSALVAIFRIKFGDCLRSHLLRGKALSPGAPEIGWIQIQFCCAALGKLISANNERTAQVMFEDTVSQVARGVLGLLLSTLGAGNVPLNDAYKLTFVQGGVTASSSLVWLYRTIIDSYRLTCWEGHDIVYSNAVHIAGQLLFNKLSQKLQHIASTAQNKMAMEQSENHKHLQVAIQWLALAVPVCSKILLKEVDKKVVGPVLVSLLKVETRLWCLSRNNGAHRIIQFLESNRDSTAIADVLANIHVKRSQCFRFCYFKNGLLCEESYRERVARIKERFPGSSLPQCNDPPQRGHGHLNGKPPWGGADMGIVKEKLTSILAVQPHGANVDGVPENKTNQSKTEDKPKELLTMPVASSFPLVAANPLAMKYVRELGGLAGEGVSVSHDGENLGVETSSLQQLAKYLMHRAAGGIMPDRGWAGNRLVQLVKENRKGDHPSVGT